MVCIRRENWVEIQRSRNPKIQLKVVWSSFMRRLAAPSSHALLHGLFRRPHRATLNHLETPRLGCYGRPQLQYAKVVEAVRRGGLDDPRNENSLLHWCSGVFFHHHKWTDGTWKQIIIKYHTLVHTRTDKIVFKLLVPGNCGRIWKWTLLYIYLESIALKPLWGPFQDWVRIPASPWDLASSFISCGGLMRASFLAAPLDSRYTHFWSWIKFYLSVCCYKSLQGPTIKL